MQELIFNPAMGKGYKKKRQSLRPSLLIFSLFIFFLSGYPLAKCETKDPKYISNGIQVPILLYHRFGPLVSDSMTIPTKTFESQMKYLKENGYTIIGLRQLLDYYLGKIKALPIPSVVITVDDGHRSVYTDFFPIMKKYHFPATLFIYPSAISNASYAMTWDQLREMKETGLFDFQSHTFWHPNFKKEKKRLKPDEYENFVEMQLKKSKEKIEKELHIRVDILAWPFGIYDDELIQKAARAGYLASLSMERRDSNLSDSLFALPRYLVGNNLPLEVRRKITHTMVLKKR